jgi:hypothetical protein
MLSVCAPRYIQIQTCKVPDDFLRVPGRYLLEFSLGPGVQFFKFEFSNDRIHFERSFGLWIFGRDSIPETPPFAGVPLGLDIKSGTRSARSFETTLRINDAKKFILFEQHCAVSTIVKNHIKRKETFFMLSVTVQVSTSENDNAAAKRDPAT